MPYDADGNKMGWSREPGFMPLFAFAGYPDHPET
jgi:hypothetical protein